MRRLILMSSYKQLNVGEIPRHMASSSPRSNVSMTTVAFMDEGTLKTPILKCRLYFSFLFGVV